MKNPNQQAVMVRLETDVVRATDKVRKEGAKDVGRLWNQARAQLQTAILSEYQRDFKSGKWNYALATKKGTMGRIFAMVKAVLSDFHTTSQRTVAHYLRETYRTSVLRNAWMLDNLTPPKIKIRLPQSRMFYESMREAPKVYKGPEAETAWKERWATWTDSYATALEGNLKLGALNESSAVDATGEVDATKAGTPASFLIDALNRIYIYQSLAVSSQGQKDVVEANPDMGVDVVWQTRYNSRVCDICDANAGLTRDEATDDIPAHPNCECYWRLVPKSWAELLRSGDLADRELARRLDAAGRVPGSMLLDDGDGNFAGAVVVSYDKWVDGQPISITSGR